MKRAILSAVLFFLTYSKSQACSWYDPDYDYFNLFTQSIIKDKSYLPFLLTFSNRFYGHEHYEIPNENIENWQKFFGNALTYSETQTLVEKMPMSELNAFKKGSSNNTLLNKLASYSKYSEGIDYLIEAKYLEPFMRIDRVESPDSFYYGGDENAKNATQLDYAKTTSALQSLYAAAKNKEIKLRYGYQLVRLNHYTRNFEEATACFAKYIEPLQLKSAPYFLALDQMAGAQRGLQNNTDANWNFFQVFINSKSRKESAFVSMKLSDSASFNHILERAQSPEEKNMAYFLLAYEEYGNPIPIMEKMYAIDPNSEILKVLAARSINELERSYLPTYFTENQDTDSTANSAVISKIKEKEETSESIGVWQKIKNFFRSIFSSTEADRPEKGENASDDQLLNNPNRIPFYTANNNLYTDDPSVNFLKDLEKFTKKTKENSADEFWKIADAYLAFLNKNYKESAETLNQIKTNNPEYLTQIDRMKMLNDLVSQPKITADYEDYLLKTYPAIFVENKTINENENNEESYSGENINSTQEFIRDILANRYFLQGEEAKSFLISNRLSDLTTSPNLELAQKLQAFFNKKNKTNFENQVIAKNINEVGDIEAFFNLIYGDFAMRNADFAAAQKYYAKSTEFSGLAVTDGRYDYSLGEYVKYADPSLVYDGYHNISKLVFGHNVWESYESSANISMKEESFTNEFPLIKDNMTKSEMANALVALKKTGSGNGENAAKANQLIGNLLYNTSILGYYRELFVLDRDNSNGGKYYFANTEKPTFQYYYKNFTWSTTITPDNFDLSIQFYKKALDQAQNQEQKARILFQMASAEQGKYYQYESNNDFNVDYDDPDWSQKQENYSQKLALTKNEKYRSYFAELKKNYRQTELSQSLQGSCSYYDYFLNKN